MNKDQPASPLILSSFLLVAGFIVGVLGLRALGPDEKAELISHLEVFLRGVRDPGLESATILRLSLIQNLKTAVLLWGFGLAVIGAPLACLLLVVRGFALGFASAFIVREVPSQGSALFWAGMFPHSLIGVPAVIGLCAISISCSLVLVKKRPWTYGGLWKMVASYTWRFVLVALGLVVSSVVEAYLSPFLLARTLRPI